MDWQTEVAVVLSPAFDQTFRRSMRDEQGAVVEQLVFQRGEAVLVPADLYPAIQRDIGHALLVCEEKDNGVLKPSHDLSAQFQEFLATGQLPPDKPKQTPKLEGNDKPARGRKKKDVSDESAGPDEPLHDEAVPQ